MAKTYADILFERATAEQVVAALRATYSVDISAGTQTSFLGLFLSVGAFSADLADDYPEGIDPTLCRSELSMWCPTGSAMRVVLPTLAIGFSKALSQELRVRTAIFIEDLDVLIGGHDQHGRFVDHGLDRLSASLFIVPRSVP